MTAFEESLLVKLARIALALERLVVLTEEAFAYQGVPITVSQEDKSG